MRRVLFIAGMGVLCAILASWAALAWAQPTAGKLPDVPAPQPARRCRPLPATEPAAQPAPLPGPGQPAANPEPAAPGPLAPPTPVGPQAPTNPPVAATPVPTAGPIGPLAPPPPSAPADPTTPAKAAGPDTPAADPGVLVEEQPQSTATPGNPTGRQEPAVSVEWVGPPVVKVGQPADFSLVVRNTCKIPVQQVLVRVRVPAGVTVAIAEPKAEVENNILAWELNTLKAGQEKNLQMKLVAQAKGDAAPQAWVTFTGSSVTSFKVREPKLTIKTSAPEKVMIGDVAAFTITVSNPGDGSSEKVKIHAHLSDGLEHARAPKVDFDIGDLAAGDTRSVTLICGTKTGGMQHCEASAAPDCGLKSQDTANVDVIMPRLDLALEGPGLRYLERKAIYSLKVTNPGDAPATNVTVSDVVPAGFKVLAASDGGRHDFSTRAVSWFLGEVGPGQTREVKLEVQAINAGEHKHKATAVGARGLRSEADKVTKVEGVSAIMVEMVDTEDPVEVNGDTAYEVRITNTGSKAETDIKLTAVVPDKEEFKDAQGPAKYHAEGKTIVFDPIEQLAPHADALFRINVKAKEQGVVYFKIDVSSTNLVQPVEKTESTRIYSDSPEGK